MLSETAETLERWTKVQMMWCSLESVFTGGDIAKQMPVEAKKFQKVDKDFAKVMGKAKETVGVLPCCANELLKTSLPADRYAPSTVAEAMAAVYTMWNVLDRMVLAPDISEQKPWAFGMCKRKEELKLKTHSNKVDGCFRKATRVFSQTCLQAFSTSRNVSHFRV